MSHFTPLYVSVWSRLERLALFSGMTDSIFRSELCETISIKSLSEGKDWTVLNRKQVSFVRRFLTTDNLAVSAQGFRRGANRVRKQMWWKVCFLLALLIIGYENASMSHWRCHNSPCHHYWYNPLQRSLLFLVVAVVNDSTDCRQEDIGWKIYTHLGFCNVVRGSLLGGEVLVVIGSKQYTYGAIRNHRASPCCKLFRNVRAQLSCHVQAQHQR
jgi:hypothetical protein